MDDDNLLSTLKDGSKAAVDQGLPKYIETMFNCVERLAVPEIKDIASTVNHVNLSAIEEDIANRENVDILQVIAISDDIDNTLGYELFGQKFTSYKEAIESSFFEKMTGRKGIPNLNKLSKENTIYYIVIPS
jgi:hypothetical protein